MTIVLRLTVVFLVAVVVRIRDTGVEEKVIHKVIHSSSVEHISMLLLIVTIHIDIASSSHLGLLLGLFLFSLPHLGDAIRKFFVNWNSHVCILLNQYDAVVKVFSFQCNSQWCVPVDVL